MNKISVFFLFFALQTFAAIPPVIEQYKTTLGNASASNIPVKVTWSGKAYELNGTLVDEVSASRWREHLILPDVPYDDTVVLQNGAMDELDPNGQVQHQGGNALSKFTTLHAIMSAKWLIAPEEITVVPNDKSGKLKVRWSPKIGAIAEVSFGSDHFPSEVSVDVGGGQMELFELKDWRKNGGVFWPHTQIIHDPGVEQPQTWTVQKIEKFDDQPFPKMEGRTDWHFPEKKDEVVLPLSLYQNRYILVPVSLGGTHSIFILDTGASSTVISQSLAKNLGLPLKGKMTQPSGIFKDAYLVRCPQIDLGGASVENQTIIALDLDSGEFGTAMPGIGGILGYDFLSRFVIVVDYQDGRLKLAPVNSFKPQADDVLIPVENDQGSLLISLMANNKSAKFILDTGNGGGVAIQHIGGQDQWVSPAQKKRFYDPEGLRFGSGIAGVWRSYVDLSVGPFSWKHAPVSIANQKEAKGGSLTSQGNVGSAFLKNFRVSIDMKTPRLWLSQSVPFRDRKNYATYGISLTGGPDSTAKVRSMDNGGPGLKAGVKIGDIVSKINGMAAGKVLSHMAALFSDLIPGESLHLTILRGSKTLELTVTAEPIPN